MKGCLKDVAGFFVSVAVILLIILIVLSLYGRLQCDMIEGQTSRVINCMIMIPK